MTRLSRFICVFICLSSLTAHSLELQSAEDLSHFPFLTKFEIIQAQSKLVKCKAEARVLIEMISKKYDGQILGGDWNLVVMMEGDNCRAQTVFISKTLTDRIESEKLFSAKGFSLDVWVTNETGTYHGLTASANQGESFFNCERKDFKNIRVNNWLTGSPEIENEITQLTKENIETKKAWLEKHFNCGPTNLLTSFELNYDVTNEAECPLTIENSRSCFLFRGLRQIKINLEK